MGKVREAFDAGRVATRASVAGLMRDPAGEEQEQVQLRGMGKWRFIVIRGMFGFGVPMCLWFILTHFSDDLHDARAFHHNPLSHLLYSWLFSFFMSALLGSVVGLLAWKRLVSQIWPGSKPDPESSMVTLGPLSSK